LVFVSTMSVSSSPGVPSILHSRSFQASRLRLLYDRQPYPRGSPDTVNILQLATTDVLHCLHNDPHRNTITLMKTRPAPVDSPSPVLFAARDRLMISLLTSTQATHGLFDSAPSTIPYGVHCSSSTAAPRTAMSGPAPPPLMLRAWRSLTWQTVKTTYCSARFLNSLLSQTKRYASVMKARLSFAAHKATSS
jgi:hypothetical protein